METVARELKAIVDESGPGVLTRGPYQVFERLRDAGGDLGLSAALLHALVMGVSDRAREGLTQAELEGELRETCHLDEEMAAEVARVLSGLFSKENTDVWEERDRAGLDAFCEHEHTLFWEGFTEWDAGASTLDCSFNLTVVVEAASKELVEDYLGDVLTKDPFMDEEKIRLNLEEDLGAMLDGEFAEWCDVDDYYPPVVEDFEYERSLETWVKDAGLRLVSVEGSGDTGDFEPKGRWRW